MQNKPIYIVWEHELLGHLATHPMGYVPHGPWLPLTARVGYVEALKAAAARGRLKRSFFVWRKGQTFQVHPWRQSPGPDWTIVFCGDEPAAQDIAWQLNNDPAALASFDLQVCGLSHEEAPA